MSQTETYRLHTVSDQEAQTELVRDFIFKLAGAGADSNMSMIDSALARLGARTVNGQPPDESGNYGTYSMSEHILPAAGWTGTGPYELTLSVPGLDGESDGFVFLSENATAVQWNAAADACIQLTVGPGGTVTFTATGEKPGTDIPICLFKLL